MDWSQPRASAWAWGHIRVPAMMPPSMHMHMHSEVQMYNGMMLLGRMLVRSVDGQMMTTADILTVRVGQHCMLALLHHVMVEGVKGWCSERCMYVQISCHMPLQQYDKCLQMDSSFAVVDRYFAYPCCKACH